jgi:fructokinase
MRAEVQTLVVGEALVDVVERPDGTIEEHPGGSPANVALALARLGGTTVLATSLGNDRYGELVAGHLRGSGVVLSGSSIRTDVRTSSARAQVDEAGRASYAFDVRWEPDLGELPETAAVHAGSFSATLAPGGDAVVALLRDRRERATISYDVNARPALMGSPDHAVESVERIVRLADVVKASDEDLEWLRPEQDWATTARDLARLGPAAVVVTRGPDGASVFTAGEEAAVAAPPVTVADTIGAGDTFSAGLLHALRTRGLLGDRDRLRELPVVEWQAVAEFAGRLAAVTVSRDGADPPYLRETAGWPT